MVTFLDVGLDAAKVHGTEHHGLRALDQLEISESGELDGAVLQRVGGLVDDENVKDDIILVDVHIRFSVDGVRESS